MARAARITGSVAEAGGTLLSIFGSFMSGVQIGQGINEFSEGKAGAGTTDVAAGGANLGVNLALTAAATTGTIGAGAALTLGLVAGGGITVAAASGHAAANNEPTPIDVMDKAYGTHFGNIYLWIRGDYSN
jgi:hypothetical protein